MSDIMRAILAGSLVMLLCSVVNIAGMAARLPPPPMLPWLGGWFVAAVIVAIIVYFSLSAQ